MMAAWQDKAPVVTETVRVRTQSGQRGVWVGHQGRLETRPDHSFAGLWYVINRRSASSATGLRLFASDFS
ncbi:hypothetical protein E2C01_064093 [Portunus trituberculatus]|uniref:Uncharacterized protein n=1 Tax=Portunus trituberculatus TaxID=210409 RepID=A0A5B7HAT5_PORTR|nr:hypothetical protein [Portunus trituberculatus]